MSPLIRTAVSHYLKTLSKCVIVLLFFAGVYVLAPQVAFAQGSKTIAIEVEKRTQNPRTKGLPLHITITSDVSSDRLEVAIYPRGDLTITGEPYFLTSIKAGEPIEFDTEILPQSAGTQTLQVKAQAWQAGENIVTFENIEFAFGDDLQIQPQTAEYRVAAARERAIDIAIWIVVITVIGVITGYGYMRFRAWLDSDES